MGGISSDRRDDFNGFLPVAEQLGLKQFPGLIGKGEAFILAEVPDRLVICCKVIQRKHDCEAEEKLQ